MSKETNSQKSKRKLEINELAKIATEEINKNKVLYDTILLYQQQLNIIKKIFDIKQKFNTNESNDVIKNSKSNEIKDHNKENLNFSIKNEFLLYYNQLKNVVDELKTANNKLLQKYETNNKIIFDESSLTRIDLDKNRIDIFILDYELKQKNDMIKKLNENIINTKRYTIFREPKRETEINRNKGTDFLNTDNLYLQQDLQYECRNYNKCRNGLHKKEKKIEKIKNLEKYLKEAINYFQKENKTYNNKNNLIFNKNKDIKGNIFQFSKNKKKSNSQNKNELNSITINNLGKKYIFDDDSDSLDEKNEKISNENTYFTTHNNLNSLLFSSDNLKFSNKSNEKEKRKKVKQKFNFLTVDELFDLTNVEGEKEVIIQDELHSDDEIIFEKKIKNKNRICTEYLPQIKKLVPGLYLNQIEFNKKKVMNEADLYSFQRREYNKQNIDENIKTMKKKIKVMKKRLFINQKKLIALIDFDKKAKEQYKVLKPLKVLSSMKDYNIKFMKNEFYNYRTKKEDVIPEEEEKKVEHNKNENDDSFDEKNRYELDDDIDDYSDKMRKRNKMKQNQNNIIMTEAIKEEDYIDKYSKKYLYNDDNKPKSK
jgi:hypothetical protein